MADCKPSPTPIDKAQTNALVEGNHGGKLLDKKHHHLYRQIVGKLMYAMVGSRPDLAYSLSILGRYTAAPDSYYLAMAKKVLAYV